MELLYKSFQARLAKEQRLKLALKEQQQQQQQQQQHQQKSSLKPTQLNTNGLKATATVLSAPASLVMTTKPPNSGMVSSTTVNNNHVNVNNMAAAAAAHHHVAAATNTNLAASEAALAAAMMQAQFLLSPDQTLLTAAVQSQQPTPHQQPTVPAYPAAAYFPYYSQMINPAGLAWPFTAAPSATPTMTSTVAAASLIPEATHQAAAAAQLMIPNVMHYNQVGVKRAAAPVMYANVEKRMKLA